MFSRILFSTVAAASLAAAAPALADDGRKAADERQPQSCCEQLVAMRMHHEEMKRVEADRKPVCPPAEEKAEPQRTAFEDPYFPNQGG